MNTQNVYDVIPLRDLERISALKEHAEALEHRARYLEQDAQELRVQADDIVNIYRAKIACDGWEACRREAEQKDMRAWRCDPLPGAVRS